MIPLPANLQRFVIMARFSSKMWIYYGLIAIAIIVCIRLGFWQLERANQKKRMLQQHQQLAEQKPKALSKKSKPHQYEPAQLTGWFLPSLLYLDNQHYQHHFGYDIISPFQARNGLVVLVNRGWVAGDVTRQSLPQIETPKQLMTIKGYVYYPSSKALRLGPQLEIKQGDRYLLQQVDIDAFQSLFPLSLAKYTLRMQPGNNDFVRAWPIVSMSPNRHVGYAIQWFAMAVCLLIVMGYFLKNHYEAKSK